MCCETTRNNAWQRYGGITTTDGRLCIVAATGMVADEEHFVIGEPEWWRGSVLVRLSPSNSAVSVYFERSNLPDDQQQQERAIERVHANIGGVIDELRPAHTLPPLIIGA
jgi:hypothetical protein